MKNQFEYLFVVGCWSQELTEQQLCLSKCWLTLKHVKDKPLVVDSVRLFLRTVPLLSLSVTGAGKGEGVGFDV